MSNNRWIEYVKSWSKKNNMSYSCSLSNPQLKIDYRKQYPTKKQEKFRESVEKGSMEDEDIDAPDDDEIYNIFDLENDIRIISKELDEELTKDKLKSIKKDLEKTVEIYENFPQTKKIDDLLTDLVDKYNKLYRKTKSGSVAKKDDKYFIERYGAEGYKAIKDNLGNYIIYYQTPIDSRGIERSDGEFLSFAKDFDEFTNKEKKIYKPYLDLITNFILKKSSGEKVVTDYQMEMNLLDYIKTKK